MNDVYVLNKNLEMIGIVDNYKSLIWANRYQAVGDCELYVAVTTETLELLQKNYYLIRPDDDMVCQIKKIELDTDADEGNYLIVTGYDVKEWLDRRIVLNTTTANGNAEQFIRKIVSDSLGSSAASERQMLNPFGKLMFYLGTAAGFTETSTEQVSYKNVGEKVREYCVQFGWGYKVILNNNLFYFQLYKGTDRTDSVIFSDAYENLITTNFLEDETNMGNFALIAGEGQGAARSKCTIGDSESTDRYEIYVDARDISKSITWQDLQSAYPNGQIAVIDGNAHYQVSDEIIADLPSETPQAEDEVILRDIVYLEYLLARGKEKLAEYGAVTSFEGTIEPNTTFTYNQDYFLGDKVTIQNEFGITIRARITEVIEVNDDNGYSIQPKFEYTSQEG